MPVPTAAERASESLRSELLTRVALTSLPHDMSTGETLNILSESV